MDAIPKAIEDLMADDPDGEVEIVLRRSRRNTDAGVAPADVAPGADDPADPANPPAISPLQASINRGRVKPRTPKSYSMPRKAQ